MSNFKSLEDFNDPLEYDAYLLTLAACKLNKGLDDGYCYERILGCLCLAFEQGGLEPQDVLETVMEMISGPGPSGRTDH